MQLPPISHRRDGLLLNGYCGCRTGACQLIVSALPDGQLQLAYHGVTNHSIILDAAQRNALIAFLNTQTAGQIRS